MVQIINNNTDLDRCDTLLTSILIGTEVVQIISSNTDLARGGIDH